MAEHNGIESKHFGHDVSCPESRFYKKWFADNCYTRKESIAFNKEKDRLKALRRKPTKEEKFGEFGLT